MKKLLIFIGLFFSVFSVCCAEEINSGDWSFEVSETGTAFITAYTGTDSSVIIPEELNGYPVTGIGEAAFPNCEEMAEISLPGSLTYISPNAFQYAGKSLVFTVNRDSYAALWAQVNHFRYHFPDEPEQKSRVTHLYESLLNDEKQPGTFHISYRVDFLKAGSWYTCDAYVMDGSVYQTLENRGGEGKTVTQMHKDGLFYILSVEEKTATVQKDALDWPGGGFFKEDELFTKLSRNAYQTQYAEHSRRMNGETYTAEVFPENRYVSESSFYFDREGNLALAYYLEDEYYGSSPAGRSKVLVTVYALDNEVDPSLFDLSAYEITELE